MKLIMGFSRKTKIADLNFFFFFRYTVTRYVEALGHFEAASSVYLNTLKFFYGNQKNVSCHTNLYIILMYSDCYSKFLTQPKLGNI